MRRSIVFISILFAGLLKSSAQGWVQEGAHLQNDSAFLVIEGPNAHFTSSGNSSIGMLGNNATIKLHGNWINNGTNGLFLRNDGKVVMHGANQNIDGSQSTLFPGFVTQGSGIKTLMLSTLVGGGYGRGTGVLSIENGTIIDLNSNRLTVNNPASNAIVVPSGNGYILGETGPVPGYGEVQWNIRDASALSSYEIPLGTNLFFRWDVNGAGTQNADSGFIVVSTYPTDETLTPNNRPMPTTVSNTNNEHGVENSLLMTDRFWMLDADGYSTNPALSLYFKHDQNNGGANLIDEAKLGVVRWRNGSSDWSYPSQGTSNVPQEYVLWNAGNNFTGIFTLSDTTPCPDPDFLVAAVCEGDSSYFVDQSITPKGTLDQYRWDFKDGTNSTRQNPANLFASAGSYPVQLKVRNSFGCWDSIELFSVVNERAVADFSFNPITPQTFDNVQFNNLSSSSDLWNWEFGDGGVSTDENPQYIYTQEDTFSVQLIANNDDNCPDTIVKQIAVLGVPNYWIPSSFSPGSSIAENSRFGLVTQSPVQEYSLQIYNRWGEKIFETDQPSETWDGAYQGTTVQLGLYLYVMRFRDSDFRLHSFEGVVKVVR